MNVSPEWYREARAALMLLQAVFGMLVVAYPLRRREKYLLRLLLGTAAGMALMYFVANRLYIRGSSPEAMLSHALVSALCYGLLVALCYLSYEETVWTALFTASTGYMAQDIAGSVKTLVRQIEAVNWLSAQKFGVVLLDVCVYGAIYLILFFALRPFVQNREDNYDNKSKTVFSLFVLVLCITMARLTQDNPERNNMAVRAEALMQILMDVLVIAVQFGVMERARLSGNVETMRELVHQQRAQYEASKESAQLINEKYHDLKNLLQSFRGTVPQEQLDQLKQSIAAYERPANSGNEVLDVLLAEKIGICQQRSIVLTCNLGFTDFSFVEELDLYSLFQNALSNAINAVSALPAEAEKFIILYASRDGNMLTIHMENPCGTEIPFENGLPQTQGDPDWHGFGMKSMNRIAEKYRGMLTAEQRGNMFFLDILLLDPNETA